MSDFTAPLRLKPRFSKRFALILIVTHGGALLLLLLITLPFSIELVLVIKLCIGLLVLASTLHTTRRHLLLINHPLFRCVLYYDEYECCIRVQLQSGKEIPIASSRYIHPQLVIFRVENSHIDALIIFPDALDVQTFRQMRVHLRHADDSN